MKRWVHPSSTVDTLKDLESCDQVSASDEYIEEHADIGPELDEIDLDEYDEPYYMLVDRKNVRDSDGFWTKYSLYRYWPFDRYVTVFGDPDMYTPDDGDFDAEFDSEQEAYEWFENYTGFEDDDE